MDFVGLSVDYCGKLEAVKGGLQIGNTVGYWSTFEIELQSMKMLDVQI